MLKTDPSNLHPELPPTNELSFSPNLKRWIIILLIALPVLLLLQVGEVLPPFIWAIVTAFIFNAPLKALTKRFGLPRWVGATAIFLLFFVILTIALFLLIPAISKEAKVLATDIPNIRRTVDDYLTQNPTVTVVGFQFDAENLRGTLNNVLERLPEIAQGLGPRLVSQTFRFLIDFLLYLISTFYFMLLGGRIVTRFIDTLPLQWRSEIGRLFTRINTVLSAYIKSQFLLILIMSAASFVVLTILGIRYSLTLAIMVGVLEIVPFVGPYLAITICCLVTFFQPHGPGLSFGLEAIPLVLVVAVSLFILRQLEDYVVIPNLIGHIVELPALVIIFTIVAGAALLGPMGLLLGVPIVAVLKIIVGYLYYKLVDADREKLFIEPDVPFEQFYQRLASEPNGKRLLITARPFGPYLRDPATLAKLQNLSQQKLLDLAFYCGEDEKTAHQIREAHFPVVTMEQEQFLSDRRH